MNINDKIAILLCTYNGETYLREQVDSIINQTYKNWVVYVSDDGSTDGTIAILEDYQQQLGKDKLVITKGPGKGFAWNFISLLCNCPNSFDYYMFSDQDDEWFEFKVERSIKKLTEENKNIPLVYCGRTLLVDETGQEIGLSPLFKKKPSFKNALIQSIAGGNTMAMNQLTRDIIVKTPKWEGIISHDWWVYILITGCGGGIIYDEIPTIKYRQHTNNIIGSNLGMFARIKRLSKLLDGEFRKWIQKNINAILMMPNLSFSHENEKILNLFIEARDSGLINRVRLFHRLGLYRQTKFGTIAFWFAVVVKKI